MSVPAGARRSAWPRNEACPCPGTRRELRSGLGGFRLFIACLALGVGAIAAILSFSRAVEEGLHADAREILGGDVAISLLYREATPEQVDFLHSQGQVARWIDSRAMARPLRPTAGRRWSSSRRSRMPIRSMARRAEGRRHLGRCACTARWRVGRGGRGGGAAPHEYRARRQGESGRRGDRGPRRHRPRARSRPQCLCEPRAAADDALRGAGRDRPGPARQPAHLGIPSSPAGGRLRRSHHRHAQEPLSRRRLAGAWPCRCRRRHPAVARPSDAVHRPDRPVGFAGGRCRRRQCDVELPRRPHAHHRHLEMPRRAAAADLHDLSAAIGAAGADRHRHRPRGRRRAALCGAGAARRIAAGAGARLDLCRAARHRGGLRPAGDLDVRAGAADPRRHGAGRYLDARRGGRAGLLALARPAGRGGGGSAARQASPS